MTTIQELNAIIASNAEQLFGNIKTTAASKKHQKLLRMTHPDLNTEHYDLATEAFQHISILWERATAHKHMNNATPTITTKKHAYTLSARPRYTNDGTVYYESTYDAGWKNASIVFSSKPTLNTLMQDGYRNVRDIRTAAPKGYKPYFPEVEEIFRHRNRDEEIIAVALRGMEELYSLSEVLKEYPNGLHGRDIAWIFRRMLVAIGNTHDAGYIHGGVSLDSVLIHPKMHGLVLRDWQFSSKEGQKAKGIPVAAQSYFPQPVKEGAIMEPSLDIAMAAHTALKLCNEATPKRIRIFLKSLARYPASNAAILLGEFDEILSEVYGKPKFHLFTMPAS